MRALKSKVRKKLHYTKYPFLALLSLKYFTRNHIYVEKKRVSIQLYKLLKELKGYDFFSISTTGSLVLIYQDHVVKIPLGKTSEESLRKNYTNYRILKESRFKEFVDYDLQKHKNHYIMDRLSKLVLSDSEVEQIIFQLSSHGSIIKFQNIKDELFANITQLEKRIKIKIDLLTDLEISSSPMHGDFTKDNIMENKSGKLVLIDLDRFTFHGINGLDLLHYEIDKYSKLQGITFFELLLHDEYIENKLSYLYLVYRMCQEYKENIFLDQEYYIAAAHCIETLKLKSLT